jgi:hypothetical protein
VLLARIALSAVAAVSLGGCITINSVSTSQPQSMGPVTLSVSACANGAPGCTGAANTSSLYSLLVGFDSDMSFQVQPLVAVRLPEGAVAPDMLTGNLSGGGTLTFTRSSTYEAELQALEPAPAGERWWGWLSSQVMYSRNTTQAFTVSLSASLPRPADGGPLPSPMHWRPVVGARFVDAMHLASRPVDCGSTNQHLYIGFDEVSPGGSNASIVCVDAPAPDATRGFLEAPLVDFGLTATDLSAPAGSVVTATFLAKRSGVADPSTTFALEVSGGPPGGTVSIDRTSVSLGGDSTTPVLASVGIPAGTAPGSYPITLTGTAAGKPTRSASAVLTVPAAATPPTPAPPPGAASDSTAPVIASASLARRRFRVGPRSTPLVATAAGTTVRLSLSEAAKLSLTVERLTKGRRKGARCSPSARTGRRCTIVKRSGVLTRSLASGAGKVPFSGRLGRRKLAVGTYRMTLVATDGAGNRSAKKSLSFSIVAR